MGRIRSVKPELAQDPRLATASDTARLLYYAVLSVVDDEGRAQAAPSYLHGVAFWGQQRSLRKVSAAIQELVSSGIWFVYQAHGGDYLEVVGWNEKGSLTHQRIEHPQPSSLPAPVAVSSTNVPRTIVEDFHGTSSNVPAPTRTSDQNQNQNHHAPAKPTPLRPEPDRLERERRSRRTLAEQAMDQLDAARARVAAKHGLQGVQALPRQGRIEQELAERIVESGAVAGERIAHVLALAEAEADADGSVKFLAASLFGPAQWARLLGMTPADAGRSRVGAKPSISATVTTNAPEDDWHISSSNPWGPRPARKVTP